MDQALFSIIIPNYNMGKYISLSIDSVISQTFKNFEIIVIDNCSTDNSWEEINKFNDKRILTYRQVANLGMYANLNVALMLAKGKYIKIHCSDDVMHPQCLEVLNKAILSINITDKPIYIGHRMITGKVGMDYSKDWYESNLLEKIFINTCNSLNEVQAGLPNVCLSALDFKNFGGFGSPNTEKDFSRDLLKLGLFSQICKCYDIELPLVFERAHSGQSRYSLSKRWQLNEVYELYHLSGYINTTNGKKELKNLAGHHLASALKYLYHKKNIGYIIHTVSFSFRKKLIGATYLKSFVFRVFNAL